MPTYEGIRLIIRDKIVIPALRKNRANQLKKDSFTIISNNCWAGTIYESFGLVKRTPTIGCFFIAKDYIKFISDLDGYLKSEISFINPNESRWKTMPEVISDKRFGSYPIGVLSNGISSIEVFFLHYKSENEVVEKWRRRISRIDKEHLLIKFNDQNGCTIDDLKAFTKLSYKNKLFFTVKEWEGISDSIIRYIKRSPRSGNCVTASYEPIGKEITNIINQL